MIMRRADFSTDRRALMYHVVAGWRLCGRGHGGLPMYSLRSPLFVLFALSLSSVALAQQPGDDEQVFGVFVDPSGTLRQRAVDAKELNLVRARARAATDGKTVGGVHFVSLNKLMAEARKHVEQNQPLPD